MRIDRTEKYEILRMMNQHNQMKCCTFKKSEKKTNKIRNNFEKNQKGTK